jgi:hypothetical protein
MRVAASMFDYGVEGYSVGEGDEARLNRPVGLMASIEQQAMEADDRDRTAQP